MILVILNILVFFFLYFLFINFSVKIKLIDKANVRKKHIGEVPLIGGFLILISFLFIYLYSEHNIYNLKFNLILYSSLIVFFLGFIDDYKDISPYIRIIFQLIAVMIVINGGLSITNLGDLPLNNYFNLYSNIFTILCVLLLINAYNFIDGADGICASNFLFSLTSIIIYLFFNNYLIFEKFLFLNYLILSVFLFFIINISVLPLKKIFLGDAGSTWLGYLLAWILIYISEIRIINPVLAIWFIALPSFDFFRLIIKRSINLKSPFLPDRLHLHHLIQNYTENNLINILIILILNILLLFIGIMTTNYFSDSISLAAFIILFILYYIFTILMEK